MPGLVGRIDTEENWRNFAANALPKSLRVPNLSSVKPDVVYFAWIVGLTANGENLWKGFNVTRNEWRREADGGVADKLWLMRHELNREKALWPDSEVWGFSEPRVVNPPPKS